MSEEDKNKAPKNRNKFKSVLWDYYVTNRQITKEYDEHYKKDKESGERKQSGWNSNAKLYLGVIIVGVIAIILRYAVF